MAADAAANEVRACLEVCGFTTIQQRNTVIAQRLSSLARIAVFRPKDAFDIKSDIAALPVAAGRFFMGRGTAQNLAALIRWAGDRANEAGPIDGAQFTHEVMLETLATIQRERDTVSVD